MRRDGFRTETLWLEIPFVEWNDGEFELVDELYNNYLSNPGNIERVKRFIITDYLTQLDNEELAKMFANFKSKKTIELEEQRKRTLEEENIIDEVNSIDDMPF